MPNKLTNFLFTNVGVPKFEAYLDLTGFRHKLISGNIANVSTPGYRSRDINFQEEFSRITNTSSHLSGVETHPAHLPLGASQKRNPKIEQAKPVEGSLNAVDIDKEVSNMAQNELQFTVAARLLQRKFQGLRNVITSK